MSNTSKKDWAYTMADVNGEVDVEAIKAIEGVVGVRVI